MSNFGISAPWYTYHSEIYHIFNKDAELIVDEGLTELSEGRYEFAIESQNGDKLQAIEKILGTGRSFGGVSVSIKYKYANKEKENYAEVWKKAFEGNPLFSEIIEIDAPTFGHFAYAVFKREIVSFYDDNLSDYNGNSHFIVADIVKDIAVNGDVFACTEQP